MNNTRVYQFADRGELSHVLAQVVAARLRAVIAAKGFATLVVSGGSTPIPMFECLAKQSLAWKDVTIMLADERQVAEEHKDSNSQSVRRHLLQAEAAEAKYTALWNEQLSEEDNLAVTERTLSEISTRFDIVILGMGDDGHTASLFPCADKGSLHAAMDRESSKNCALIKPATAPHGRITQTLKRLLFADQVLLHIVGKEKQTVLKQAMQGHDELAMPIRAFVNNASMAMDVFWSE